MRSVNPADGKTVANHRKTSPAALREALERAEETARAWRERPVKDRTADLGRVADVLERDLERHARLITAEMGKPITEARAEVEKCVKALRWYARHTASMLESEEKEIDDGRARVRFDPLGVVLAVMPWNYPYWQVVRFAAPNLAAGNVGLLKHASNVPGCSLAIAGAFVEAGLPEGAFQALLIDADRVEELIADDRIAAVTLTGSEGAGRAVAAAAGRALKPSVLELGGSDPFIVLDDADLDAAAKTARDARFQNAGQSCIAAKRFLVVDAVYDAFRERFLERVEAIRVGDPMDDDTEMGPLAKEDIVEDVERQLAQSVRKGAAVLLGGERLDDREGFWFAPTVAENVEPGMPLFDEEVFGPVAALIRVADEEEAVTLANRSRFGLGAAVFTRDLERAERLAVRIESGQVFVNRMVASDPRLPFGGVKASGYGRELERRGLLAFLNHKTVALSGPPFAAPH